MADPVALQIKSPDMMHTLGNVMNIATQSQALRKAQATFGADVAQRESESRRAGIEAGVSEQTAQPRIEQQRAQTSTAQTHADSEKFHLQGEQAQKTFDSITALLKNPAVEKGDIEGSVNALAEAKDRAVAMGVPRHTAEGIFAPFIAKAAHGKPGELQQVLKTVLAQGLPAGGQVQAATPSGPVMGSGQVTQLVNTAPLAGATGPVAGTQTQQEVPPTATTVGPGGQAQYVGPRKGGAPIPAGNPPGLEASAVGSAGTANKDWESTTEAAKTASTDIANLQNIKRFAGSAQTGVGSERRAFVAGLAGLLGMDAGEMSKTKTDLLAKNANMLALAGGDTNLAKTLAESANPNTHMTKEAILEASNQVMSQRRMALAKQDFLRSHKALNNPDSYNQALTEWNKVADPRIFQWPHMDDSEKKDMKGSMTEKEQKEFRKKIERAVDLGIVR